MAPVDRRQLEQAIGAQEQLRGSVPDAISLGTSDDEAEGTLAAGARLDLDDIVAGLLARRT